MKEEYKSRYCAKCGKEVDNKNHEKFIVSFEQKAAVIQNLEIFCKGRYGYGGCDERKYFCSRQYVPDVFARLYEDYYMPNKIAEKYLYYKNKIDKEFASVIAAEKLQL